MRVGIQGNLKQWYEDVSQYLLKVIYNFLGFVNVTIMKEDMSCSITPTEVKSTVHPYNYTEIHCALWLAIALGVGAQELWNAE